MPLNITIDVDRQTTGAYIEVFERDGRPVARMNFFDGTCPRPVEELVKFHKALSKAIALLKEDDPG